MISIHYKGQHSEATTRLIQNTVAIVAAELKTNEKEALHLIAGLVDRLTETVSGMVEVAFDPKRADFMAEIESGKKRLLKHWIGDSKEKVEAVWSKRDDLLTLALALHRQDLINRMALTQAVEAQAA
jgi:hypothetical protein